MKRTNIHLEERQANELDVLALNEGISRAELVRRIIDRAIDNQLDAVANDLAAIRESSGAFPGSEPDLLHRGEDERRTHLERTWKSIK